MSPQRHSRQLATLMAIVMFFSPVAYLRAQAPTAAAAAGFETKYITPEAAVVAYIKPRQILTSPRSEMLPRELATTAGLQLLGIDAAKVEQIVLVAEPPMNGPPQVGVILSLSEKFDINDLPQDVRRHTVEDEAGGRKYFKSQTVTAPSFFMPDDTTLYIATQGMLKKQFAKEKQPAEGPLVDKVKARAGTEDFYLVADVQALMPFIDMGLMQAMGDAPPEVHQFLEGRAHLQLAELALHVTTPGNSQLQLHATDAAGADKLEALVDQAIAMGTELTKGQSQQMAASADPYEAAMGRYGLRVADKMYEPYRPQRQGEKFVLVEADLNDPNSSQVTTVAIIGVLVALLLPAVQGARGAAQRAQGANNMKQLLLSFHNYHDTYRSLPAHATYDDQEQPLLSWRVHMLPFLEEQALYEQFHLDEPWDSEHNKALIAQMPEVFLSPRSANTADQGLSNYVVPVGEGFLFDGTAVGAGFRNVTDGTSNTIALLEVDDENAVPWTAPEDWEYDEENPTKGLFGIHPGIANVGFADGSVQAISELIDIETLLAMLTKAGGEIVNR